VSKRSAPDLSSFCKMHRFRIDEWVIYRQFPDAQSENLRKGKKAVVLDILQNNRYEIYIDDPEIDDKWRRKVVNAENLEPID
jgi:hypothetical protein